MQGRASPVSIAEEGKTKAEIARRPIRMSVIVDTPGLREMPPGKRCLEGTML